MSKTSLKVKNILKNTNPKSKNAGFISRCKCHVKGIVCTLHGKLIK